MVMFGPSTTPVACPPTRSATASRHAAVMAVDLALAGNTPPSLPMPTSYAPLIASITDRDTWVPAAPSR